ncbi:DNA primase [Virgibacillus sp. W0181]|uniref:DNA primase n=1 Tax=Virgibacillus sp. W0181 TaxID=3391581 RepID=UPI003F47910D
MSNRISEEVIENVRKSIDITDVVSEYVQLKKQGRNYFGLCPFHGEQTPSFSVTEEKQIFHCFGCGKGGNVISFLMEMENLTFLDAIKNLADRSGIQLPNLKNEDEPTMTEDNQNILAAHTWLSKLYHHLLKYTKDGKEGLQYLIDRGITEESINTFQLGYAPITAGFTADFLQKKGFHQQFLIKSGLLTLHDDHTVVDRFRGRVIFPIRNHLGKPVAFGGRSISSRGPKYLNSSESDLFHKSKLLYNFDLAKRHIRKKGEVIIFEGYMDVIAAYQAGTKNVIATLGTSLSGFQAKLLKRYVNTVIICYDADHAGVEASYQAARLLREAGCEVKVANLKDDMDPDSFILKYGADAFEDEVIRASDTFIKFYMQYVKKDFNLSIEGERIQYIENVLKEFAMIESSIEREYYIKELSEEFNLSVETLNNELRKYNKVLRHKDKRDKNRYTNKTKTDVVQPNLLPAFHNAERLLLASMLQDISIVDKVQTQLGASFNIEAHKIIVTHLYAFYEEYENADIGLFMNKITDDKLKQLVAELAMIPLDETISENVINDCIHIIKTEYEDSASIGQLKKQQKQAEQQNDPIKAAKIAMEIIEKEKLLKQLK